MMKIEAFFQQLWRWLIQPSPKLTQPDERRQGTLLSAFLLGIILVATIIELITVALIEQEHYVGYRITLVTVTLLAITYAISRTERIQLASILTVIVASLAIFAAGWSDPSGVGGGLFDFMIIPIWLGSLYMNMRRLVWLIAGNLIGFLLFPVFVPEVSLNFIIVGPFSFIILVSVVLIITTRYRNQLESDRQAQLAEKERNSRREAARADALLRVAGRLNAQLDLDTLLTAICEEAALALHTSVAFVALYDEPKDVFLPMAAMGILPEAVKGMVPFPRSLYDATTRDFGTSFGLPDLQDYPNLENLQLFKQLDLHSMALATMHYEQQLIGSLSAMTRTDRRTFSEDELLLLGGLADQAALAIVNTRLYKDARRRLERLQALRAIDLAISSNHNLQDTLNILLSQITQQLHVDAAVFLLLDEARQQLEFGTSLGFQTSTLRYTSLRIGEGMAGRAAQQRKTVHIRDVRTDPQSLANASAFMKEGFVSYYASPLISQGSVKGVLEVFHRSLLDTDSEWMSFLDTLASQAAIAIENTSLFEDLERTNDELLKAYDATIEGWSYALDLRDKETEGHTQRVTKLAVELARAYGFSERELTYIRWGALLHDIGKMGVPDRILLKEGPLTGDEWAIMQQHPVHAHEMLRTISYLRPALDIPYCHHEKWDGTGYPLGLKGAEIPLTARIFAVIDVWDALTSDRPYRAAWTREKTLTHIREGAGSHFDPQVVEVFTELVSRNS